MPDVKEHYDAVAAGYSDQYQRDLIFSRDEYPANFFRLQLLVNSFAEKGIKRVFEVGVGEGTPLSTLARAGIDVSGFDISPQMVAACKETLKKANLDPERVFEADIREPTSYAQAFRNGQFDAVIAMGVMPHVENDDAVLDNISTLVKPGGTVFIEFRNKIFSLFTFNRYTMEFILDDLLAGVSAEIKNRVRKELEPRLRMDLPPIREKVEGGEAAGYDAILSRFHNPFEMPELFRRHGFRDVRTLWYHYHPAMPLVEREMPAAFRSEGIKLEREASGWRGIFLCSAFVIEAVKI